MFKVQIFWFDEQFNMSLDDQLTKLDGRIHEVEVEINRLTALKRKLISAREKLQDKKYLEKTTELANNDWNHGKIDIIL